MKLKPTGILIFAGMAVANLFGGIATAAPTAGQELYYSACAACHGAYGEGVLVGVPDFTADDSALMKPDDILLNSILKGLNREDAPMNMPAGGGVPNLTESQARELIEFMRLEFLELK